MESEIGRRIKASRINKRFTLEQLANQTGFTKGYLSRIEKFAQALGGFPLHWGFAPERRRERKGGDCALMGNF